MSSRIMSQRYTKQESDCLFSLFNLYCYKTHDYPTFEAVDNKSMAIATSAVDNKSIISHPKFYRTVITIITVSHFIII